MKWFAKLKIGAKILTGFILVAIIAAVIGALGIYNMGSINRNGDELYQQNMVPLSPLNIVAVDFQRIRVNLRDVILNNENLEQYERTIKQLESEIDQNMAFFEKGDISSGEKAVFDKLAGDLAFYRQDEAKVIAFAKAHQDREAFRAMGAIKQVAQDAEDQIKKLYELNIEQAKQKNASNLRTEKQSSTLMMVILVVGICFSVGLGFLIAQSISKPVNKLTDAANKLAVGDINVGVDVMAQDEIGILARSFQDMIDTVSEQAQAAEKIARGDFNVSIREKSENDVLNKNLNRVIQNIQSMARDVNLLKTAALEGRLDTRSDATRHEGEYRRIIDGFNQTLDAIVTPLSEAENVLSEMAVNDYTLEMTGQYQGLLKQFAEQVNMVRDRLLSVQDIAVRVSKGDISRLEEFVKIGKRSENDKIVPAFRDMMQTIQNLINETERLSKAAVEGNLKYRGQIDKFEGGYQTVISGFNNALDAILTPFEEAKTVLMKMSENDISTRMTGQYQGMFKDFADEINQVQERLLSIQDAFIRLAKGDTSRLAEMKQIGKRSENDKLLPSMTAMMESIQGLIEEISTIAAAVRNGDLNKRADASRFEGGYREVILGLNNTVEAFLEPMIEANQVLRKMAVNDYTLEMMGQYNGAFKDFADQINGVRTRLLSVLDIALRVSKGDNSRLEEFIKIGRRSDNDRLMPAFKEMMQVIQDLIRETVALSDAAINGNLSKRGDEERFEGGYREIIRGMNQTMDAVARPIQEASEVLGEMAEGNLTVVMTGDYQGEYDRIKESVNLTIQSFNSVLNDINNAAAQVAAGSKDISNSSGALSQGATEQASAVEELSSSLEEISSQTKQNAANANQANELAEMAKVNALQGNDQMKEMLTAMNDINESSGNISKIIKVIDEIAFQTNILALNAAVEAARAGQYGKGFAVVAEEVRNLAARSADAADETTAMIEGSIKKVEYGTKIADNTAHALADIVSDISKVAGLVGDIAVASNEQATGIAQINQGVIQVSQVVQSNTATSEESAAASEELASQAELLKDQVARFKLLNHTPAGFLEMAGMKNQRQKPLKPQSQHSDAGESFKKTAKKIILNDVEFGKY